MKNLNLFKCLISIIIFYLIFKKIDKLDNINHMEKCRNCGRDIDSTTLYCPYCHEEHKKKCDNCGRLIDVDWRFCPFCQNEKSTNTLYK